MWAALATYAGCYIDKGMPIILGLTPDVLGEIYDMFARRFRRVAWVLGRSC